MKMGKHSLLMMLGCGVMLVGLFLLPLLGVKLDGALSLLFVLACPLSMVLMMGFMGRGHGRSRHAISDSREDHGAHCPEEEADRSA